MLFEDPLPAATFSPQQVHTGRFKGSSTKRFSVHTKDRPEVLGTQVLRSMISPSPTPSSPSWTPIPPEVLLLMVFCMSESWLVTATARTSAGGKLLGCGALLRCASSRCTASVLMWCTSASCLLLCCSCCCCLAAFSALEVLCLVGPLVNAQSNTAVYANKRSPDGIG